MIFTKKMLSLVAHLGLSFATVAAHAQPQSDIDSAAVSHLRALNTAFTGIARQVTASVVTIRTSSKVSVSRMQEAHPFYGDRRWRDRDEGERTGLGSGIIVSADGYILTNHHVAGSADRITVILTDNREFEAGLVGTDSLTDIAVIKVDTDGLSPANIGDSDRLKIGEWVVAVGAPLQLGSTVTAGIVSAIGRDLNIIADRSGYAIEDFIQTDAAINPGNSGGPLVNLEGRVVGVNTAIASSTGTFMGYGFAIPINLANKVMDDIVRYGRFRRGFLGVRLRDVDAGTADAMGFDRPMGVLIEQVLSESPAEVGGLRDDDIILDIDGRHVNRSNQVQSLIARRSPDESVDMRIQRSDRTLSLSVRLGERSVTQRPTAVILPPVEGVEHFGLSVEGLTAKTADSIGVDDPTRGVLVVDVGRGPARDAGLAPGDVILRVWQRGLVQDIRNVEDFETALERLEAGRNASFVIVRAGARRFVSMQVPGQDEGTPPARRRDPSHEPHSPE